MDEDRLYQEYTYSPNDVVDGFDIYVRMSITHKDDDLFGYSHSVIDHFLVTVYDEQIAKAFVDRLNKHWDDIYEIPRWTQKFLKYT